MTHYQKKRGHGFVQQSVRNVCAKFTVDPFSRFRTGARHVLTTQKPFPSEIPWKLQHQIPNTFSDQIIMSNFFWKSFTSTTNLFSQEKVNIWTPSRYFPFWFHFSVEMKQTRNLQQKKTGEKWKIIKPITLQRNFSEVTGNG